jgi:hypothetical protein
MTAVTINIPDSPKEREEVLHFLESKGLLKRDVQEANGSQKPEKSRWARLAHKLSQENHLGDGVGDIFRRNCREFRDDFVFKSFLASTAIELGAILVSNDKIYLTLSEYVPDFKFENWTLD